MADPDQPQGEQPDELTDEQKEELRRKLEEQLRQVRVQDVLLESVASIINLSGRRIVKEDERDLEQARVGIDAVRAVVDLLAPEPREQVRQALSELQMLYARAAGEGTAAEGAEAEPSAPEEAPGATESGAPRHDSGLWTPPGSS
jgi:hypothetical protein